MLEKGSAPLKGGTLCDGGGKRSLALEPLADYLEESSGLGLVAAGVSDK